MTLDRKTMQEYQERYESTLAPRHFVCKRVYRKSLPEILLDLFTCDWALAALILIVLLHVGYHLFIFAR